MKKNYIILIACVIVIGGIFCFYLFNKNSVKSEDEIKYYTYEGKFVMSSSANKVDDYNKLKNNYFIKETISNVVSDSEIIEVFFSGGYNEPYNVYGYYTISNFNKYFSEYIKAGLVCDGEYVHYLEEAASYKCIKHESGYKYKNIDSELCANINDELVCVKANNWNNNASYKEIFEKAGWKCEYYDYSTTKYSKTEVPSNGYLDCSKVTPSERESNVNNELFFLIDTDGEVIINNNLGWCKISNDLNTYCFGIN